MVKRRSSHLPFLAQSGNGRYIFRPFILVCTCICYCEACNKFTNPQENGLNKMVEVKECKFQGFPEDFWSFIYFMATGKEKVGIQVCYILHNVTLKISLTRVIY